MFYPFVLAVAFALRRRADFTAQTQEEQNACYTTRNDLPERHSGS